jgi:hypothetical protein
MPVPYWAETMNGFEYSAAVLMIQCGLMEEGMAIVEALRDRYDGAKRNPWNEFECGSNYARSMASYSLLNVFSGFSFDMPNKSIGFAPVTTKDDKFNCLWSLGPAWGVYSQTGKKAEIRVLGGEIALKRISLPFKVKKVVSGSKSLEFQNDGGSVVLGRAAVAASGASLVFS